jgi:hypothetical protein
MKGPSKGRTAGLEIRQEWTERLHRFAAANTPEEKQAVFDHTQQINPGGTLRKLLEAWGYSASGRGRKKASEADQAGKPARERLEASLKDLFGHNESPVKSLYPKLAGKSFVTVSDASRIVAALLAVWPESLKAEAKTADERRRRMRQLGEDFMRTLLAELSGGRSRDWSAAEMDVYAFRLEDEERIGASQFVKEAGGQEGALIVASTRYILVGKNPVQTIREFHNFTSDFIDAGDSSLLIFVFNAGIFDAGDDRFDLLFNLGHLATAITAFALFQEELAERQTIRLYKVDWSRWRRLAARCCVVVRRPPLITNSGEILTRGSFDDFISAWLPPRRFDRLPDHEPIRSFGGRDILPRSYPAELGVHDTLSGKDLYWDVTVRPSADQREGLKVEYFIPPAQPLGSNGGSGLEGDEHSGRGRRPSQLHPIEGDSFYIIRKDSPGEDYDDAQRTIYRAARGRLHLDSGEEHEKNLLAAAALREAGYETLPIAVAMSLLPRSLYYAAAEEQQPTKKNIGYERS